MAGFQASPALKIAVTNFSQNIVLEWTNVNKARIVSDFSVA